MSELSDLQAELDAAVEDDRRAMGLAIEAQQRMEDVRRRIEELRREQAAVDTQKRVRRYKNTHREAEATFCFHKGVPMVWIDDSVGAVPPEGCELTLECFRQIAHDAEEFFKLHGT